MGSKLAAHAALLLGLGALLSGCSTDVEAAVAGVTPPRCGGLTRIGDGQVSQIFVLDAEHRGKFEGKSFDDLGKERNEEVVRTLERFAARLPDVPLLLAVDAGARWRAVEAVLDAAHEARIWNYHFILQGSSSDVALGRRAVQGVSGAARPLPAGDSVLMLHLPTVSSPDAMAELREAGTAIRSLSEQDLLEMLGERSDPTFVLPAPGTTWESVASLLCLAAPSEPVLFVNGGFLSR